MRIESSKPMKNGGWWHPFGVPVKFIPPPTPEKTPTIDAGGIMREFSSETWPEMRIELAASLGVSLEALEAIGCAWAVGHNAWAFPMKDWRGKTIGIRLRDYKGHKWAVRGSRSGLFYQESRSRQCVVVEGPTDAAAAITIGLDVIGRPACLGCDMEVVRLIQRKGCERVVLIADNDGPGINGASKLQTHIPVPSCIAVLPCKDIRMAVQLGFTKELFDSIINTLVWHQPTTATEQTRNYQAQQHGVACT